MERGIITPDFIAERIDSFWYGEISVPDFGNEMIGYLTQHDRYTLQPEHQELLTKVLSEFMHMHDVGRGNVGYEPYVPTEARLIELKQALRRAARLVELREALRRAVSRPRT